MVMASGYAETLCMGRKPAQPAEPPHFLRAWRKQRGMSLEAVGEELQTLIAEKYPPRSRNGALKRIGVTHGNLSRVERGLVPYNQPLLELLAVVYRTDPGSLLMSDPDKMDFMWAVWDELSRTEKAQAVEVIKALKKAGRA